MSGACGGRIPGEASAFHQITSHSSAFTAQRSIETGQSEAEEQTATDGRQFHHRDHVLRFLALQNDMRLTAKKRIAYNRQGGIERSSNSGEVNSPRKTVEGLETAVSFPIIPRRQLWAGLRLSETLWAWSPSLAPPHPPIQADTCRSTFRDRNRLANRQIFPSWNDRTSLAADHVAVAVFRS